MAVSQDHLKTAAGAADDSDVTAEITESMHQVLGRLVDDAPGVVGAIVASSDGFVLADRLPPENDGDARHEQRDVDLDALAAMSAATIALSNQLAAVQGPSGASVSHHVSDDGQVMLVPIAHVAVLTLLATPRAEAGVLVRAGHDAAHQLQRLFRGSATV